MPQDRDPNRPLEIAEGIYRLGTKWVNFYLVKEGNEFSIIDAGYPGYFDQLSRAMAALGAKIEAIRAVLVTHHHVDHAGTAEQLRTKGGAHIYVGAGDVSRVDGDEPSHPPSGFYKQVWRPSMVRYLAHTVAAGGARYRPAEVTYPVVAEQVLDLPGRPQILSTPGHTAGHYSVAIEERGVLFTIVAAWIPGIPAA